MMTDSDRKLCFVNSLQAVEKLIFRNKVDNKRHL